MPVRAALGALLLAGTALVSGCAGEPRQNVLMIVVDTLRRDHLGCYGYARDTSPEIDRFAAGATRYEHAYAAAPWTTPSIGALLASRYPSELGISAEPDRLDDRFVVLAEVLAAEGYITGAVIGHYFLGREWSFDQGFHHFDESHVLGHAGVSSPGITRRALEMLAAAPPKRPFFLLVHYFDPHYDYVEHEGYRFSDPAYDGPVRSRLPFLDLLALQGSLTAADRARLVDLYDSEIAFTDAHIGRLLAGLEDLGLADDTVVVLTADHGEELLDRGGIGHGHSLYDEQIAVPLVIRYPGGEPGVVERGVGLIDVYPTLLAHLRIGVTHRLSGRSFLGAGEAATAPRPIFAETDWGGLRGVVAERLKLVRRLDDGSEQLFDLAADPGERDDLLPRAGLSLAGHSPAGSDAEPLREPLDTWLAAMERAPHRGSEVALSDEARAELRALGYLRPR